MPPPPGWRHTERVSRTFISNQWLYGSMSRLGPISISNPTQCLLVWPVLLLSGTRDRTLNLAGVDFLLKMVNNSPKPVATLPTLGSTLNPGRNRPKILRKMQQNLEKGCQSARKKRPANQSLPWGSASKSIERALRHRPSLPNEIKKGDRDAVGKQGEPPRSSRR